MYFSIYNMYLWLRWPLLIIWFIICVCEANRTPFDLAEAESELVSGFNTEYSGGLFSLIFISEYGSIIFLRLLCLLFFGGFSYLFFLLIFVNRIFFIWIRGTFPRLRYFRLINLAWKKILFVIMYFFLISLIF
jgi:NADH-ubiquinone oxidoreductase chain 1